MSTLLGYYSTATLLGFFLVLITVVNAFSFPTCRVSGTVLGRPGTTTTSSSSSSSSRWDTSWQVGPKPPRFWGTRQDHDHDDYHPEPRIPADRAELEAMGGDPSFLMDVVSSGRKTKNDHHSYCDDNDDTAEESFPVGNDPVTTAELEEIGGDPSFLMNLPGIPKATTTRRRAYDGLDEQDVSSTVQPSAELAELLELGGDPSFLMEIVAGRENVDPDGDATVILDDPVANGGDDGFASPQEVQREAEIAKLLEVGGDPSFLLDVDPPTVSRSSSAASEGLAVDRVYRPEPFRVDPHQAVALEAAGGDPFFLPSFEDDDDDESTTVVPPASTVTTGSDRDVPAVDFLKGDSSWGSPPTTVTSQDRDFPSGEPPSPLRGDEEGNTPAAWTFDPAFLLEQVSNQDDASKSIEIGTDDTNLTNKSSNHKNNNDNDNGTKENPRRFLRKSSITNEVLEEEIMNEEAALLDVGGDPAFLDSFDEFADSNDYDRELRRAEIEDMGGDPSFL